MTRPTTSPSITSVVLVEDDRAFAQRTEADLCGDPSFFVIASVSRISEVEVILRSKTVDLIVLDLVLQGKDRYRAIGSLKEASPGTKILVLTAFEEPDRIFRALCAGADGYLVKSDTTRSLGNALRETIKFGSTFSPAIANAIARHFHATGRKAKATGWSQLSDRETELLQLLARGLRNKEIAGNLGISVAAVKKRIESICQKLQAKNRTEAVARSGLWPNWL